MVGIISVLACHGCRVGFPNRKFLHLCGNGAVFLGMRVVFQLFILCMDDDDAIIQCCPHLMEVTGLTSWKLLVLSLHLVLL